MKTALKLHIFLCFILAAAGCMPEQSARRTLSSANNDIIDNTSGKKPFPNEDIVSGISEVNFFQQAATSTTGGLSLFADFKDSFLMRGDNLHAYLKNHAADGDKRLCMAVRYPYSTEKNVLVMAARVRNFHNSILGGKEYYLQMEPNNETANVNDCLNVEIIDSILKELGSNQLAHALGDVCPTCKQNLSSGDIRLFLNSGVEASQVRFQNLALNVLPAQGSTAVGGVTCQSDSLCRVEGFDCCLANQCVNHGQLRPDVDTSSPHYLSALEQILGRPQAITNYADYFYICPQMLPTDPGSPSGDGGDPVQQANDLFIELQDLYNCLNPVLDEFSICTVETPIDLSKIGSGGGTTLYATPSDINFQNLNPNLASNNIVSVSYAGKEIYREKLLPGDPEIAPDPSSVFFSDPNDDLDYAQSVRVNQPIPSDASSDKLKASFRIDGTCEKLGPTLARCEKYYVQGQISDPPRSSDHPKGNDSFKLPHYASFDYNIVVEVGGSKVASGNDTWVANRSNRSIDFFRPVYNNERIKITYFVVSQVEQLTAAKEAAKERVNLHCKCDETAGCNLKPVYDNVNGEEKPISYICEYGQPDIPAPPLQKTVYLSAKSVPHRYYDRDGVHYEQSEIGEAQPQEGNEFRYLSNNELRPNNQNQYIGFNEIYGSFSRNEISAMPAAVIDIKKGVQYDIFVDSGVFSSCLQCGNDYFSHLQKLFPGSFLHMGGGYLPNMVESRLKENKSDFSGVDLKFGRACFVPATMIPWTHKANENVVKQRRDRLAAQHFMFANGYNRDWYGFDYGSLIGSHDGVRWFSIGNQRRVQAKSNKLYLAINAYFGDLTIDNSFKVVVSELSSIINAGSAITHDTESDGAQCQKAHFCSTDNDCIAQLGYEYSCQSVNGVHTPWPMFDGNGNEISGSVDFSLLSLVGGSNGSPKRCVYRGAGALCQKDLLALDASKSYNSTSAPGYFACSANTHCASFDEPKFNDRIARYGRSPASQNNHAYITDHAGKTDTFGLAARQIGRPFDFLGDKTPPGNVASHLNSLNVRAMCVPGSSPVSAYSIAELNLNASYDREADKALGIGKTYPEVILRNNAYYGACPATNDNGVYTHTIASNLDKPLREKQPGSHMVFASAQNMSTNALIDPIFDRLDFFLPEDGPAERMGYNKASCLRAAGASCFSDYECSPNSFISQKIRSLSRLEEAFNLAEKKFWEEELVCANSQERYIAATAYPNPVYELNEHKCCRATGREFTFSTQYHKESDFEVVAGDNPAGEILLPGINQNINSPKRYSRTHTIYDKLINEREKYPPLYAPGKAREETLDYNGISQLLQYNTLHLNNSRMCCTGNWVRNFADGGHKFTGQTQQRIDKSVFKPLNWLADHSPPLNDFEYSPVPFHCSSEDWQTADCEVKNIPAGSQEEKRWLAWFGKLELLGIPQVMVETNQEYFMEVNDGSVSQDLQSDVSHLKVPLSKTVKELNNGGVADASLAGKEYYSAASYDNFEMGSESLKQVFSEDSFSCCVPTGVEVDGAMENSKCCTGQVHTSNPGQENESSRCCLNDFADVSVYTNRYVSSEGAFFNGQPVEPEDPTSGYLRKEVVLKMAATMCCSGQAAYGVALGDYYIPIDAGSGPAGRIENAKSRRWLYLQDLDNAEEVGGAVTMFDLGLKWNDHVYCIPAEGGSDGGEPGSGVEQD